MSEILQVLVNVFYTDLSYELLDETEAYRNNSNYLDSRMDFRQIPVILKLIVYILLLGSWTDIGFYCTEWP